MAEPAQPIDCPCCSLKGTFVYPRDGLFLFINCNRSELVMGDYNAADQRIFSKSYSHSNYFFYGLFSSLLITFTRR